MADCHIYNHNYGNELRPSDLVDNIGVRKRINVYTYNPINSSNMLPSHAKHEHIQ